MSFDTLLCVLLLKIKFCLQVEIVGLVPPKPSLMLLKSTTTTPSTASEDLLLEGDDEYEEETTKPISSISSMVNENEALNETI